MPREEVDRIRQGPQAMHSLSSKVLQGQTRVAPTIPCIHQCIVSEAFGEFKDSR
jgi:hypothetical protein